MPYNSQSNTPIKRETVTGLCHMIVALSRTVQRAVDTRSHVSNYRCCAANDFTVEENRFAAPGDVFVVGRFRPNEGNLRQSNARVCSDRTIPLTSTRIVGLSMNLRLVPTTRHLPVFPSNLQTSMHGIVTCANHA